MERVHDVGGQDGFGGVPLEEGDVVPFEHDWEARIFGIYRALAGQGLVNPHEMRWAVERIDPDRYLHSSYYERWIDALELIAAEKGLLDEE